MIEKIRFGALQEGRWYEYLARFLLGGVATVTAGLIADAFGPRFGGLFLAFPAVFCASASLVERHERRRKAEKGLKGKRRGTLAAALDSKGAAIASVGLATFALSIFLLSNRPFIAAATGIFAWIGISYASWRVLR